MSLKFICLLLHANHKNKIDFCKLMDIAPADGRTVLNSFPKSLLARSEISEILKRLKEPVANTGDTLCLVYDISVEKLTPIKLNSYEQFEFVDPLDYLVLIDSNKHE